MMSVVNYGVNLRFINLRLIASLVPFPIYCTYLHQACLGHCCVLAYVPPLLVLVFSSDILYLLFLTSSRRKRWSPFFHINQLYSINKYLIVSHHYDASLPSFGGGACFAFKQRTTSAWDGVHTVFGHILFSWQFYSSIDSFTVLMSYGPHIYCTFSKRSFRYGKQTVVKLWFSSFPLFQIVVECMFSIQLLLNRYCCFARSFLRVVYHDGCLYGFRASVYTKPTFAERYCKFNSHHPYSVEGGIAQYLKHRTKDMMLKQLMFKKMYVFNLKPKMSIGRHQIYN